MVALQPINIGAAMLGAVLGIIVGAMVSEVWPELPCFFR